MNYRKTSKSFAHCAEDYALTALYGQLSAIRKTMDEIVKTRENISENGKSVFKFTKQEIKAMPEHIRKIFIANNYIVNYRITSNGYFEARIRRKGMYIEASGRDFETMRTRFMQRLAAFYDRPAVQPQVEEITPEIPTPTADTVLFGDYGRDWLKIKEQTTKPSTYKEYERSFRVDLEPMFGNRVLAEITRNELQNYLFGIVGENKHRKAEKLALMLNCIFDMAAEDFSIPSPMKKVVLPNYQTKKGQALTKDEEERLIKYCKSHREVEGTDALLVLLLFGLRKSELASIEIIDGKWLQCETSKERLGQNVVLRKIPFTPQAKKYTPFIDFEKAKRTNLNTISTRMKRLLPERHPHELRHTFISRCKECGVASEVVSIWAGHSLSVTITSTVYTHYSEEFQLKEAEKVIY